MKKTIIALSIILTLTGCKTIVECADDSNPSYSAISGFDGYCWKSKY